MLASVRYEIYGPGGAAVILDCRTDHPERTAARVREALRPYGGHLGAPGSVGYLFNPVGRMAFPPGVGRERLTRVAVEAGAEEVVLSEDRSVEVLTDPVEFEAVRALLAAKGFTPAAAQITERAATPVRLDGEAAMAMVHLLEALEDLEETQDLYTNAEIPDEVLARV